MGRRPVVRSSEGGDALFKRLRELRERRDLSAADRRRLERIIRDIGDLDGIDLDDIAVQPDRPGTIVGDFDGVPIKPVQLSNLIGELAGAVPKGADGLEFVAGLALERLRAELPEALPLTPVPTGRKGAGLPVTSAGLTTLLRLAAVRRSEGAESVVWDNGVNQLMVEASKLRAVLTEGMVRVAVPVECDQVRTTMEIPFAVGSAERAAGLIVATADRPAGDPLIAGIWGEALIAFAYGVLLDIADSLAGASGRDEKNGRLVPRGFVARRGQLVVESQARFLYERSVK
jgi:hypothetical protein